MRVTNWSGHVRVEREKRTKDLVFFPFISLGRYRDKSHPILALGFEFPRLLSTTARGHVGAVLRKSLFGAEENIFLANYHDKENLLRRNQNLWAAFNVTSERAYWKAVDRIVDIYLGRDQDGALKIEWFPCIKIRGGGIDSLDDEAMMTESDLTDEDFGRLLLECIDRAG